MLDKSLHIPFGNPLNEKDSKTSTYGCRHKYPQTCVNEGLKGVCALVRKDKICKTPPPQWGKQYKKLGGKSGKKEFADYVLKRKRINDNKVVVHFYRNNLSFEKFSKSDGKYIFYEEFFYHGLKGVFKCVVYSNNLLNIFTVSSKRIRIRGREDHFGIFLKFPDQRLPLVRQGKEGCVEFYLSCDGKGIRCEEPSGGDKRHLSSFESVDGIPQSVSWSVSHPYQGGAVSPK